MKEEPGAAASAAAADVLPDAHMQYEDGMIGAGVGSAESAMADAEVNTHVAAMLHDHEQLQRGRAHAHDHEDEHDMHALPGIGSAEEAVAAAAAAAAAADAAERAAAAASRAARAQHEHTRETQAHPAQARERQELAQQQHAARARHSGPPVFSAEPSASHQSKRHEHTEQARSGSPRAAEALNTLMTRNGASTRAANGDPAGKPAGTKRKRAFTYDHARHSVRLGLRVGKRDKQSGAPINVVCLFCEHLGRELTPVEIEDEERERLDANGPASSGGEEKRKAKRRKTGVEFLVRSFYVGNVKRHLERWHRTAFAEYERLFRSGGERAVARFFDPAPPVTVVTGYGEDANMFSTHTPSMPVERCEQAERPVHAPKSEHEPVHCHAQQPVGGGEMEQEFESPGSHEPDAYSTEFQKLCERVGEQELSFEQVAELVAKVAEKPEIYPLVLAKLPEHDVRGTGRTSLNTFVSALSFLKHHLV